MEDLKEILKRISIQSSLLTTNLIQVILNKAKAHKLRDEKLEIIWKEILDVLWTHLGTGLNTFDDQLLCAICFYTVLKIIENPNSYFIDILYIINDQLNTGNLQEISNDGYSKNYMVVSLMYGMFQSAYFNKNIAEDIPMINTVLAATFKLLMIMAYEYSQFTFIVFKTISSLKKVNGTCYQEAIFNKNNQIKLLNLVNHNWENPTNGVKDLNKSIFHTLMLIMDDSLKQSIIEEINGFYWNKAKYLMITEYLEQCDKQFSTILKSNDWLEGCFSSLYKSGLVSAGADLYFAILKKIGNENEWCDLFLAGILKILNAPSNKAAENLINYWILPTFKKYPTLYNTLITNLVILDNSQNTFSVVSVIKQGIKAGLTSMEGEKYSHIENLVLSNLEHCNVYIRMFAFDIICQSQRKLLPKQIEYEIILSFLINNVNSDCTILRLNMLNSLNIFLTLLHMLFINRANNSKNEAIQNLLQFCKSLQKFIINSVYLNGNYQRKITSLKITNLIFSCFNEVPKKKQKQIKMNNGTLMDMLKLNECWILSDSLFINKLIELMKDPADDIRQNVSQLLLNHYSRHLIDKNNLNYLIEDALKSIKSKFFYQINCGQSLFKLIANIIHKEKQTEASFKNLKDIFSFVCNELLITHKSQRNILESITSGTQLHSMIGVLQVILEVCFENSYKFEISKEITVKLLNVLEDISNQFALEQKTSSSSDFSKMSTMVDNIICNSSLNHNYENKTNISGLHQIVLNCLWLNVKAACDLTSLLIQYHMDDLHVDICEKGLTIIIHVLETSRHKGAIEAAGAALGQIIYHLTSLSEETNISKIPHVLLKSKLNELILEASKMASVTRRGAGLSIMVHKIVSNDMKKRKPLFHYFINTLLETCKNSEDLPGCMYHPDIDNEKDLPKAVYIHFLTKIVMDSSLSSNLMYYSSRLAELALNNLANSHWQIRNAALQLYGALIPKLIGQKKISGTDEETVASVGYDEFRTHSPKLWQYMECQLKTHCCIVKLETHSSLIPILNILGNTAKRYTFSYDRLQQRDSDIEMLKCLMSLLGSPINTVRRLSANCISNNFTYSEVYKYFNKHEFACENFLHGSFLLIDNYQSSFNTNNIRPMDDDMKGTFFNVLNNGPHSYLCKMFYEKIYVNDEDISIEKVLQTFSELDKNKHMPGAFVWANMRIKKYIQKSSWENILQVLRTILSHNDYEHYCGFVYTKLLHEPHLPEKELFDVVNILIAFKNKFNSFIIWKILYQISLKIDLRIHANVPDIYLYLESKEVPYKLKYMIPFMVRLSMIQQNTSGLITLSIITFKLTDPAKADTGMRYIAALANNEYANKFTQLPDVIKINSLKTAVILLQDEDDEVRNLSAAFYEKLHGTEIPLHPHICLRKILESKFLNKILTDPKVSFEILCKDLNNLLLSYVNSKIDEHNPFANDSKNIYMEVEDLSNLIKNIKIV